MVAGASGSGASGSDVDSSLAGGDSSDSGSAAIVTSYEVVTASGDATGSSASAEPGVPEYERRRIAATIPSVTRFRVAEDLTSIPAWYRRHNVGPERKPARGPAVSNALIDELCQDEGE